MPRLRRRDGGMRCDRDAAGLLTLAESTTAEKPSGWCCGNNCADADRRWNEGLCRLYHYQRWITVHPPVPKARSRKAPRRTTGTGLAAFFLRRYAFNVIVAEGRIFFTYGERVFRCWGIPPLLCLIQVFPLNQNNAGCGRRTLNCSLTTGRKEFATRVRNRFPDSGQELLCVCVLV